MIEDDTPMTVDQMDEVNALIQDYFSKNNLTDGDLIAYLGSFFVEIMLINDQSLDYFNDICRIMRKSFKENKKRESYRVFIKEING